jgi:hypothetical protein
MHIKTTLERDQMKARRCTANCQSRSHQPLEPPTPMCLPSELVEMRNNGSRDGSERT